MSVEAEDTEAGRTCLEEEEEGKADKGRSRGR